MNCPRTIVCLKIKLRQHLLFQRVRQLGTGPEEGMQAPASDTISAAGLLRVGGSGEGGKCSHSFLHGGRRREELSRRAVSNPSQVCQIQRGEPSCPGRKSIAVLEQIKALIRSQQPLAGTAQHHPIPLRAAGTLARSTRGARHGSPGLFDLSRLQSFATYRNTPKNFSFILPFPLSGSSLLYQKQR